ncbi:ABC transporter permease subunit/CPBP intramembrane protease [Crateriforma spongiae]|uniref:ABC transporter permease subunit/CPBP intramembrane protease n=1 Tax=Crateriforma spongiae TaxID=2724528 RepID=UPI0014453231|nr:ABC transporter permease subunit/CPBP intramembrane protease [Crateriforma spongiae]
MKTAAAIKRRLAMMADSPRIGAIALIYAREMRDQLRDRRTLFTIAVLPILLYPLVGMLLLQIAQFTRQHPTTVCVIGRDHLDGLPPLLSGEDAFAENLIDESAKMEMSSYLWDEMALAPGHEYFEGTETPEKQARRLDALTTNLVRSGRFDVVLQFPPGFAKSTDGDANEASDADALKLMYNVGSDQSMVAKDRVIGILNRWRGDWVRDRLESSGIDLQQLEPFQVNSVDIAPEQTREAAFWSKLLPFVMLVWAMTGAFYPAIDLVAGEKERGTLETLLCSPALRSEIVWGKLGAVMTFSMMTAILNAGSMLVTSSFVFKQIGVGPDGVSNMGAPPLGPMMWLLVALVPLSALFSALALAVAAMARSSKEGQYYLMPLMMVTLPLVLLPMLPGTTLSPGTSVIPVTGMFLLVRALVEGQYYLALAHLPIVATVTGGCLLMATRWARRQFESESVLFGDGDQWELGMWVRHLWRDRQTAATVSQAFACGAIILVALFFGKLAVTEMPQHFGGIAQLILMPQIGMILAPTLLMATMMTTSLRTSLRLRMPHWTALPMAVLIGLTLHPTYVFLAQWISQMYPISEQAAAAMKPFTDQISSAPWLTIVFLMALVPAICEELAFRGFIFGGLLRGNGRVRAVVVSAIMFGVSHGVLQQSIAATCMGLLLGWVALRTGSVLPGILIHFTNNAMSVSLERLVQLDNPATNLLLRSTPAGPEYHPLWLVTSMAIAISCLLYLNMLRPAVDEQAADRVLGSNDLADPTAALVPAS